MKMSPLNLSGLKANAEDAVETFHEPPPPADDKKALNAWARQYRRYRCTSCEALHKYQGDAELCCPPDVDVVYVSPSGRECDSPQELIDGGRNDGPMQCPVCREKWPDARTATDCCLWKDLNATTRYAVADKVAAGATWAEALGLKH